MEQTLREFFKAIQEGRDAEQSWKKSIYKIISRLDDPVPEYFKSPNFLEQLEWPVTNGNPMANGNAVPLWWCTALSFGEHIKLCNNTTVCWPSRNVRVLPTNQRIGDATRVCFSIPIDCQQFIGYEISKRMCLKESEVLCQFSCLRMHSGLLLLKIVVLSWQQKTIYYISSPQAKVRHDEQWNNQSIYVIALDNWNHFTWTFTG